MILVRLSKSNVTDLIGRACDTDPVVGVAMIFARASKARFSGNKPGSGDFGSANSATNVARRASDAR